jgi:hypothetical protein
LRTLAPGSRGEGVRLSTASAVHVYLLDCIWFARRPPSQSWGPALLLSHVSASPLQ